MSLVQLKNPGGMAVVIIEFVVAILLFVALAPTLFSGFTNLSAVNGFYFSSMFQAGGVAFIAVSAAILLAVLGVIGLLKNRGSR